MTKEDHLYPKRPHRSDRLKQVQTHNVPTNKVESTRGINTGKDLLFATNRGLFQEKQKGCRNDSSGTRENTTFINTSSTRAMPEGKNLNVPCIDYKKGIWYGFTKLDKKMTQNIQDIGRSHKLYQENHENLEREIDSMRQNLSWNEDPGWYNPERCTITITICNCVDNTQPQENQRLIQNRRKRTFTLYTWTTSNYLPKLNKNGHSFAVTENIKSGHRNIIWYRKICHADNKKWEMTNDNRNGSTK